MKRIVLDLIIGGFILIAVVTYSFADSWQPSHTCHKPYKPFSFGNQWELDNFRLEVQRYKRCIEEFVEEQEEAIRNHRSAANEAIDEWNGFIRYNH